MLREFNTLTPEERQLMYDAIPLITILVATADNELDEVELGEAQRLADIRSYNNRGRLNAFYEQIDEGLAERVREMYNAMPKGREARDRHVFERLEKLNDVFPKIRPPYGYLYYDNFHSFARHIAQAHGGFLRYITIGPREAKVVDLPMIKPIEKPPREDYPELY